MTNQDNQPKDAADLRQKAEALARQRAARTPEDSAALSPEEIRDTLHELRVHQIELEMQNEELRTAQATIEAGWARYFDLYDLAPVGYCTLSENGLILEANLTATALLEMNRGDLIKKPISRFILKEDQDIYYLHRKKLFETGEPQECELRLVRPKGTHSWAHLTATIAQTEDGTPVCRVVLGDITERKQIEAERENLQSQLNQTQKMEAIGTLAGGIAHDFNNMLAVITGNISYALSILNTKDDELFKVLSEAQQGVIQSQNLTNQLLTFAKGGEPIKQPSNINRFLKESARFVTSGAKSKCEFNLTDDLWITEIDSGQMNQVIANLVINAEQSMPNGGIITIRTENAEIETESDFSLPAGRYIKISIEDQGAGIPKQHLSKIFNPYFTTKQKGSGLGLATTFSIIKRHGGLITVNSEVETGTAFDIYLPASSKDVQEVENKKEAKHKGLGRILIMDDQELILNMLGGMVNKIGYEAVLASDGTKAIDLYREAYQSRTLFDLVILDLTVPGGLGGAKTIPELLKIDSNVKAIISSGYSNDPIMANYEDYGFCGILPKPYTIAELSETLNKIFGEKG